MNHINLLYINIFLIVDLTCVKGNLLTKLKRKQRNEINSFGSTQKSETDPTRLDVENVSMLGLKSVTTNSERYTWVLQGITDEPQYFDQEIDEVFAESNYLNLNKSTSEVVETGIGTGIDGVENVSRISKVNVTEPVTEKVHGRPPPMLKYEPMEMRDETGHLIDLDKDIPVWPLLNDTIDTEGNISALVQFRYKYPKTRNRWWWEYQEHHGHWIFWHCNHWMTFWEKDPPFIPNVELSNMVFNDWFFENHKEPYFYKYCRWLLEKVEVSDNKTVNRRFSLRSRATPKAECYYCNAHHIAFLEERTRSNVEGLPLSRVCHRAFTDPRYFKFKYLMRALCNEAVDEKNELLTNGSFNPHIGKINIWGMYRRNQCLTLTTDIGELYTERDCRRSDVNQFTKSHGGTMLAHIADLVHRTMLNGQESCWTAPYATLVPMLRSKVGVYVRATVCVCTGEYCNFSLEITELKEMMVFFLVLTIFVV